MAIGPIGGLSTGLDVESLISQIIAAERRPVVLLESRRARLQAQSSALGTLGAKLAEVKTQATALSDPETLFARSVTSSEDTVATATADRGSVRGTYALTVTALARGSIATATATKAALTDTIAAGDGTFTFRLGTGDEVDIAVTDETTLADLVDAINDAGAGVQATAINMGTAAAPAYRLTLTSEATGADNDIVVVGDGTTLAIANTQAAANAAFTITGIGSFTRASNTVTDALAGVTVTLKAEGATDLALAYSTGAIQAGLQGLVNAYNDVVRTVASQTATVTGADGKAQPGILGGDVTPRSVLASLRTAATADLGGTYATLSAIGITMQRDGTLLLDASDFQEALAADPQAFRLLVAGNGTTTGIADRLAAVTVTATQATTGTVTVRKDGLTRTIDGIGKQVDAWATRLGQRERALRAQFLALEKTVGRLKQTESSLSGYLRSLQNLERSLSS